MQLFLLIHFLFKTRIVIRKIYDILFYPEARQVCLRNRNRRDIYFVNVAEQQGKKVFFRVMRFRATVSGKLRST